MLSRRHPLHVLGVVRDATIDDADSGGAAAALVEDLDGQMGEMLMLSLHQLSIAGPQACVGKLTWRRSVPLMTRFFLLCTSHQDDVSGGIHNLMMEYCFA